MLIKKTPVLLISGVSLIFFGLNHFFEFINFEHQKNNAFILMILSITSLICLMILRNKANNLK
jgi:Ca2+/H+ antiporter